MSSTVSTPAGALRPGPECEPVPQRQAPPRQLTFRQDVEGLRALAVTLVVLFHAGVSGLSGGYIGVDVFFVISGFLITDQLLRELGDTGTISITGFYARRAVRLLPAASLVIGVTMLVSWLWLPPARFAGIAMDALATTFYGLNYRLATQGTDYLDAAAPPSPLQHFWSLAVEEQFYLIWPVLLIAVMLLVRRTGRTGVPRRVILITLAMLIAGSFALSIRQSAHSAPWAYFGIQTRAWELAAGAAVAVTATRWAALPRTLAITGRRLGLAAIIGSAFWFTEQTPFPGYAAALPVFATVLVLGAGCAHSQTRTLGLAPVRWIGRRSYGWYLWHWPALVIAPYLVGSLTIIHQLALAALSLLLAAATWTMVENPLRGRTFVRTAPWRGIGLGVTLSGSLAAVALAAPVIVAPQTTNTGFIAVDTLAEVGSGPPAERKLVAAITANAGTTRVPDNLTPALATAGNDYAAIYHDRCSSTFADVTVRRPCFYGDLTSTTTIVLFGDSHAGQWFPSLDQIATQRGWRLAVVTKSACSAASVLIHLPQLKREYHECVRWRDSAIGYIRSLNPSMVVMSSVGDGNALNIGTDQDRGWAAAWQQTFTRLAEPGTRQILILDTAWPASDAPECVSAHLADVTACHRPLADAVTGPTRRPLVAAAASAEGVTVIDPLPWLCTETHCPVIVGNVLVYYDASHLSATYSRLLAPVLAERLPSVP